MTEKTEEARQRAQEKAERQQKAAQEGAIAFAEYRAETDAVRERTVKLRELRLAKEAAERAAAAAAKAETKTPRKRAVRSAAAQPSATGSQGL